MHLPWLAQQYERTCADCGHAWRVPRQFARRRMRISFRGLLTGGGFRTGGGSRGVRRGRIQSRDPVKRGNRRASGSLPQVPGMRLRALLAAPGPFLSRPATPWPGRVTNGHLLAQVVAAGGLDERPEQNSRRNRGGLRRGRRGDGVQHQRAGAARSSAACRFFLCRARPAHVGGVHEGPRHRLLLPAAGPAGLSF
jgi:hypothetical protein